jgi:hypothetical protein
VRNLGVTCDKPGPHSREWAHGGHLGHQLVREAVLGSAAPATDSQHCNMATNNYQQGDNRPPTSNGRPTTSGQASAVSRNCRLGAQPSSALLSQQHGATGFVHYIAVSSLLARNV